MMDCSSRAECSTILRCVRLLQHAFGNMSHAKAQLLFRALFEAQRDGYDGEQCSIDSFSEEQLKDLLLDTEKHSLMDINYEDFTIHL